MRDGLGFLEIEGLCPSLVVLDAMDKAADIRLLQLEFNDFYGVCIKLLGSPASLRAAIDEGRRIAGQMGGEAVSKIIDAPTESAWPAVDAEAEFNALLQGPVVIIPSHGSENGHKDAEKVDRKDDVMSKQESFAIGLIETQGFTAVFEAIDTACKAADVKVIGKEKLGGGYVTVLMKGDVAAVRAAVDAGKEKVEGLGTLIAAHVIPRPSEALLSLITAIGPVAVPK